MIMKQAVKEAAKEYSSQWAWNSQPDMWQSEKDFKAGAEWQANQSPWISVEERLPEEGQNVLVLIEYMGSMQINENTYWKTDKWTFGSETEVLAWMPIPSFDEILEANKDVLQRIKEKGTL